MTNVIQINTKLKKVRKTRRKTQNNSQTCTSVNSVGGTQILNSANTKTCQWLKL